MGAGAHRGGLCGLRAWPAAGALGPGGGVAGRRAAALPLVVTATSAQAVCLRGQVRGCLRGGRRRVLAVDDQARPALTRDIAARQVVIDSPRREEPVTGSPQASTWRPCPRWPTDRPGAMAGRCCSELRLGAVGPGRSALRGRAHAGLTACGPGPVLVTKAAGRCPAPIGLTRGLALPPSNDVLHEGLEARNDPSSGLSFVAARPPRLAGLPTSGDHAMATSAAYTAHDIGHWIDGRAVAGTQRPAAGRLPPGQRPRRAPGGAGLGGRGGRRGGLGQGRRAGLGRDAADPPRTHPQQLPGNCSTSTATLAAMITAERQGVHRRAGRGHPRHRHRRVRLRRAAAAQGDYTEQVSTGIDNWTMRQPLGVVAGITPFNFPHGADVDVPGGAGRGNAFVLKPSDATRQALGLHGRSAQAGGPADGVFNVVQGRQGGGGCAARITPT